jgi:hypothetical protein
MCGCPDWKWDVLGVCLKSAPDAINRAAVRRNCHMLRSAALAAPLMSHHN